jgi:hypothetical protein
MGTLMVVGSGYALAGTLQPAEMLETIPALLMKLFPEEDIRLFDPRPVR